MVSLQPGLREIGRIALRLFLRFRLRRARRQREKTLTQLGLLGWEQADFEADAQRQVDEIQNVEREQSRAINQAADAAREVRRLISEREAGQRAHSEKRRELEAEFRQLTAAQPALEQEVAAKRQVEPNFQRRIPELDRELREVNKLYSQLITAEKQTPKMKQELIYLRERSVAIPNEKNDLRTQHLRAVTELRALEERLAQHTEATRAAQQRVQYADSQWQAKSADFNAQIKAHEKDKNNAERQLIRLEAAKENPYLKIGEVLAASGIAPVNQPETLDEVRQAEVQITLLESQLEASQAETASEDPRQLRLSFWLCVAGGTVLLVFIAWLVF